MKKILLTLWLVGLFSFSYSQNMQIGSYLASNGVEYKPGSEVELGQGSNATTKEFNFVYTNPNGIAGKILLPAQYDGLSMPIKKIRQLGTKKLGYKTYLICAGGNITNYWVDIESAIKAGEVLPNNE